MNWFRFIELVLFFIGGLTVMMTDTLLLSVIFFMAALGFAYIDHPASSALGSES